MRFHQEMRKEGKGERAFVSHWRKVFKKDSCFVFDSSAESSVTLGFAFHCQLTMVCSNLHFCHPILTAVFFLLFFFFSFFLFFFFSFFLFCFRKLYNDTYNRRSIWNTFFLITCLLKLQSTFCANSSLGCTIILYDVMHLTTLIKKMLLFKDY